jgi:hypothetical protein
VGRGFDQDRGFAGPARRGDPGLDRDAATGEQARQVEAAGEARAGLMARRDPGRDQGKQQQGAQGERVVGGEIGRGTTDSRGAQRGIGAGAMGLPERGGERVGERVCEGGGACEGAAVFEGGDRAVGKAGIVLDPPVDRGWQGWGVVAAGVEDGGDQGEEADQVGAPAAEAEQGGDQEQGDHPERGEGVQRQAPRW